MNKLTKLPKCSGADLCCFTKLVNEFLENKDDANQEGCRNEHS